jgi:glucose-1-phosphate adenylyltransferase
VSAPIAALRVALLAGGYGKRMGRLGRGRVKPAIPFGTRCHLMDFSLLNAERSGVDEVVLLSRYHEELLHAYLRETWHHRVPIHLGPFQALHERPAAEVYGRVQRPDERGTADALIQNWPFLAEPPYRDLLVLHSDHVYRFDYRPMYDFHRNSHAALTIGYQQIPREFVSLFGMVELDEARNLRAFVEKPPQPTSDTVFTAVCIFDLEILHRHLTALRDTDWAHDISRDVIPHMLQHGEVIKGYPFTDYWEDIGTAHRYHRAHMRLIEGVGVPLADMPQILAAGADCTPVDQPGLRRSIAPRALAAAGRARVDHSVVFAGAEVGAGAVVERSVLLPGSRVAPGARVVGSIVCGGEHVETDWIDRLE